jgi:hypothetical protein
MRTALGSVLSNPKALPEGALSHAQVLALSLSLATPGAGRDAATAAHALKLGLARVEDGVKDARSLPRRHSRKQLVRAAS